MKRRWKFAVPIVIALNAASLVHGQDINAADPQTRMEWIAAQQEKKAGNLVPAEQDRVERALDEYIGENPLNKYMGGIPGLHLRFGGLPSGSGLGFGPEYLRPDLANGQVSFRASAVGSQKLWYGVETELRFPHLARRYLDLRLGGNRMVGTSYDYYGPGPDSDYKMQTQYEYAETAFDVSLGFRPTRRYLTMGFSIGFLWLDVSPGNSDEYSSTEEVFGPDDAPGIDNQTNYLHMGPFLEVDSRDKPKDPHSGTHLLVRFSHYDDRKFDRYSFRQFETSIEQYVPFFNKKRVIALRLHSVLGYPEAGSEIPFYMQSTLGGSSTLRGYRRYRFYDDNLLLLSVEYRWEVFTIMDAAVFMDAGKVFHTDGDFSMQNLESDAGFGFRFKTRKAVVLRFDTAFSHEGYGVWFTFDHVY